MTKDTGSSIDANIQLTKLHDHQPPEITLKSQKHDKDIAICETMKKRITSNILNSTSCHPARHSVSVEQFKDRSENKTCAITGGET